MEHVRREVILGSNFSRRAFERAFLMFRQLYQADPRNALCSPDVLARYCALFECSPDAALRPGDHVRHQGIPLAAAVLPPGMIVFEGEVDEHRMGDW